MRAAQAGRCCKNPHCLQYPLPPPSICSRAQHTIAVFLALSKAFHCCSNGGWDGGEVLCCWHFAQLWDCILSIQHTVPCMPEHRQYFTVFHMPAWVLALHMHMYAQAFIGRVTQTSELVYFTSWSRQWRDLWHGYPRRRARGKDNC